MRSGHVRRQPEAVVRRLRDRHEAYRRVCAPGKGWEGCRAYCHDNASFSSQADALAGITTLQSHTDWMSHRLDYVYSMEFDGDRIRHMTKIWNDVHTLKQLGWVS